MAGVEASVRDQVNREVDCAEGALHLIGLRKDMKRLIGEWIAAGGGDRLPDIRERVGIRPNQKNVKLARAASRR